MTIPSDNDILLMDLFLQYEILPSSSEKLEFYDKHIKKIQREESRIRSLICKDAPGVIKLLNNGTHYDANSETQEFINSGSFKNVFDKQKEEIKEIIRIENLKVTKLEQDVDLGSRQIRFYKNRYYWSGFFIIIGSVLAILARLIQQEYFPLLTN